MTRGSRVVVALVLGVGSFFVLFALGEGVRIPASVTGAKHIETMNFVVGMGAYFFVSEFLLSRGNRQAVREDWPIIVALNAVLAAMTLIAVLAEENRQAVLQMAGVTVLTVVCSYLGAALAARVARPQPL